MGNMPCFSDLKRSLCQNTSPTLPLTLSPGVTGGRAWRRACSPVGSGIFAPGAFQDMSDGKFRLTSWACSPPWSGELVPHKNQDRWLCVSSPVILQSAQRIALYPQIYVAGQLAFPSFAKSSDGGRRSMMAIYLSLSNRGVLWTTS